MIKLKPCTICRSLWKRWCASLSASHPRYTLGTHPANADGNLIFQTIHVCQNLPTESHFPICNWYVFHRNILNLGQYSAFPQTLTHQPKHPLMFPMWINHHHACCIIMNLYLHHFLCSYSLSFYYKEVLSLFLKLFIFIYINMDSWILVLICELCCYYHLLWCWNCIRFCMWTLCIV